jgi:hypothetical protein
MQSFQKIKQTNQSVETSDNEKSKQIFGSYLRSQNRNSTLSQSELEKQAAITIRLAPGEGLEPSSPEGHQLARDTVQSARMISRLTPFRGYCDLPSLGTPAHLLFELVLQFMLYHF